MTGPLDSGTSSFQRSASSSSDIRRGTPDSPKLGTARKQDARPPSQLAREQETSQVAEQAILAEIPTGNISQPLETARISTELMPSGVSTSSDAIAEKTIKGKGKEKEAESPSSPFSRLFPRRRGSSGTTLSTMTTSTASSSSAASSAPAPLLPVQEQLDKIANKTINFNSDEYKTLVTTLTQDLFQTFLSSNQKITVQDLTSYETPKPDEQEKIDKLKNNHFSQAVEDFNALAGKVRYSILYNHANTNEGALQLFKLWTDIAHQSMKERNFSGAQCIYSALQSTTVSRLTKNIASNKDLEKEIDKSKQKLEELEKKVDVGKGKQLFDMISKSKKPIIAPLLPIATSMESNRSNMKTNVDKQIQDMQEKIQTMAAPIVSALLFTSFGEQITEKHIENVLTQSKLQIPDSSISKLNTILADKLISQSFSTKTIDKETVKTTLSTAVTSSLEVVYKDIFLENEHQYFKNLLNGSLEELTPKELKTDFNSLPHSPPTKKGDTAEYNQSYVLYPRPPPS